MLTATLIARDEARCIVRCLDSVRPWVDRMVVLDTGSRDATIALARRAGADVHETAWSGDFSAARNQALDLADADWNLIIDADEWISSGGEALRAWCTGAPRLGRICVHSAFDAKGSGGGEGGSDSDRGDGPLPASRSWLTRVLPRGARFRGRVHEQIVSPLPRERIELHLQHDGYRDQQMASKRGRNRPLLLLDLKDHPEDPYIAYQLGREAEGGDAFAEACDWYARAMAGTAPAANWFHELLVRYLHSVGQAGRLDDALAIAWDHMEAMTGSPDFFFVFGNLLLDRAMADPTQAIDRWLPLAVAAWERCIEIGETPELEGSVHGRGSYLAQRNLDAIRGQFGVLGR